MAPPKYLIVQFLGIYYSWLLRWCVLFKYVYTYTIPVSVDSHNLAVLNIVGIVGFFICNNVSLFNANTDLQF